MSRYDSFANSNSQEEAPLKVEFNILDYPNNLKTIPAAEFNADRVNLFIAFEQQDNILCIEDRGFPLLRPPPPTAPSPKPGFISFIGETGSGKSWILRALKRREDRASYPLPIVAPGLHHNNSSSTSANVHLYADGESSKSPNPILFLDFEGLSGSTVPSSLNARFGDVLGPSINIDSPRYLCVQDAYPRIAYAFSNCVVFVADHQLAKAQSVAKLLTDYSNCAVKGSRHLGFKPALFVIFNQIPCNDPSPSSWSIDDSTTSFPGVEDLLEHYHKIFVIKIPRLTRECTNIVIDQLDRLDRLLREQHSEASERRVAFRLDFTADQIMTYLTQALRVFTSRRDAVFDWLEHSLDQRGLPASTKIAEDMWIHFFRYFRDPKRDPKLSPIEAFQRALEAFYSHFVFCVRLHLARHPLVGRTGGSVPAVLEDTIRDVDQAISLYVPCGGASDGFECDGIQQRHNDSHACGSTRRWKGTFMPALKFEHSLRDRVKEYLASSGSQELSVKDSDSIQVLSKIRSAYSCVGCLNYPSTFLSCEHGFCEECVEDITKGKDLHRLVTIECPFCQNSKQRFSPRFLPRGSGYRILSLDGGGVRGIAQVNILRAIEMLCFDIPIVHLFDIFIGTSIGGHLVLALASRESPLTLSNAPTAFRNLVAQGFKSKNIFPNSKWPLLKAALTGSTKYKATALEANLKGFFQESPRLLSARDPPSPHVAVTAASRSNFEKRVIPNYMRSSGDSDDEKRRLVLSAEPKKCMPTWVAARCTSAAVPYFKGYEWNGEHLLDGGFVVNCPADLALDEARCVWPNRRMDTLVSVGTGASIASPDHADDDHILKVAETAVNVVSSSQKLWDEFIKHHNSEKGRIFRLQPEYKTLFSLDAVNKVDIISHEVDAWLTLHGPRDQIDRIGNQLIASLFFFKPSALDRQSGTQSGSIECRLPPGLKVERQKIFRALIKVARDQARQLFTVDISCRGGSGEHVSGAIRCLEDLGLSPGAELSIPVTIEHLPPVTRPTIDIKLCHIFGNEVSRYSISGCPFTVHD